MVKIGIIDSGIDQPGQQIHTDIQGIFLKKDQLTNETRAYPDIQDHIGHGNECFKIISSLVKGVSYYIVKIFEYEMLADVAVLAEAIRHCLDQQVTIINISAGVIVDQIPDLLRVVCDEAYDRNVVILSAKPNEERICYPANYKKVFGVGASETVPEGTYTYVLKENIEFYTSAADLYPDEITWSGSPSFACAKMTGFAAQILKAKGAMNIEQLSKELINHIDQRKPLNER